MTKFYTYLHIRNDSSSIFYVGKGTAKRSHSTLGRNPHWHRIIALHGYTIQIVEHFESEADSFAHERYLIASLRACGTALCNIMDGGAGGACPGAGRPIGSLKTTPLRPHMQVVMTNLTDPQRELFKQLGGAKWLREYLERRIKRDPITQAPFARPS